MPRTSIAEGDEITFIMGRGSQMGTGEAPKLFIKTFQSVLANWNRKHYFRELVLVNPFTEREKARR